MKFRNRLCLFTLIMTSLIAMSLITASCRDTRQAAGSEKKSSSGGGVLALFGGPKVTVPAGSTLEVRLSQTLSSKSAHEGDSWHGTVVNPVLIDGREVIPSGSVVNGVIVAAEEAERGSRARLQLGVTSVRIRNRQTSLQASAEPVVAGSPRARNLGAIAGGAAAGAIIGKATGDNATKGAVIGGAIATGAVAASKGYQVVLSNGAILRFVVRDDVAVRV